MYVCTSPLQAVNEVIVRRSTSRTKLKLPVEKKVVKS